MQKGSNVTCWVSQTTMKDFLRCKMLNFPRWFKMFRKEFQEAIKNTISKYKTIVFGADTLICTKCLNELRNQQVIDQIVYRKMLI